MAYTVYYFDCGSWQRALEFVEPSKITKRTKLINGKVLKPIRRETFEEAKKVAAFYMECGVKITEVK